MTGQALERHQGAGVALVPNEQERAGIEFNAKAIYAMDSRLKGRSDAKDLAFGLAVTLWNYGMPGTVINAKKLHLIPAGKDKVNIFESAQMLLGVLTMHGHDVWFVEETEDRVVLRGRRFGQGRTHEVAYDADRARKSGALDEWVERKVKQPGDQWETTEKFVLATDGVAAPGPFPEWAQKLVDARRVKRNDYWWSYRVDALGNRAIRRMAKRLGADALLGVSAPDPGDRIEPREDDIVVEVEEEVDAGSGTLPEDGDEGTSEGTEPTAQSPSPLVRQGSAADTQTAGIDLAGVHRNECSAIYASFSAIPEGLWRQQWAKAWREAGFGKARDLTPEQLEPARQIVRCYRALAALDGLALKSTADRHAFVAKATGGESESTKALTAEQLQAVLDAVADEMAFREAAAADEGAGGGVETDPFE